MDATLPAVLYLDDDPGNLKVFKASFARHFPLFIAESVAEASRILENETVGAVLSDQRMPEMTGIEFLKSVREVNPNIVRMIVTAYSDMEVIVKGINEAGISRYITKPWKRQELYQILLNAIETYELRLENLRLIEELREVNAVLEDQVAELQSVNSRLSSLTLQLVEKSRAMEDAERKLSEVQAHFRNGQEQVQAVANTIKQQSSSQAYWKEFTALFDKVQSGFFSSVQNDFPELTPRDLKLLALIKLNLSAKELAGILGISPNSVNMARYRLRKKMNLDQDDKLEEVIARYS